jgi:hypothetical protein
MSFLIYKPFGVKISKEVADKLYSEYKFKKLGWIHREEKDGEFKPEKLNNIVPTTFEHIMGDESEVLLNISSWGNSPLIMPPYEVSDNLWYFSNEEYKGIKTSETTSDVAAFLFENIVSLVSDETALSLLKEFADNSPDLTIFLIKNKKELRVLSVDGYKKMAEKDGIKYSDLKFLEEKKSVPIQNHSTPPNGYHHTNYPVVPKNHVGEKRKGLGDRFSPEQRSEIIRLVLFHAGSFMTGHKSKIYTAAKTHLENQEDGYLANCLECYGLKIAD